MSDNVELLAEKFWKDATRGYGTTKQWSNLPVDVQEYYRGRARKHLGDNAHVDLVTVPRHVIEGLIKSFREVESRPNQLYDAATHRWVDLVEKTMS